MRLFGNKRGVMEDIHVYLIQLVMILGYSIAIIAFVANALNGSTFEKTYITRDLAFITTAIFASPGNVFYEYNLTYYQLPLPTFKSPGPQFQIEFLNKQITLTDKEKKSPVFYSYASDLNYITKDYSSVIPPSKIYLAKEGNIFRVNSTLEPNLNAIDCNAYWNESVNPKRILIDIPHNATNLGYTFGAESTELLTTCRIANYLKHQKNENIEFEFTHSVDSEGNIDCFRTLSEAEIARRISRADYVIILHGGAINSTELSPVKAYVLHKSAREKDSLRLACQLVNSILSSENIEEFTGAVLIPADSSLTNTHVQIERVNPRIPTIILEIGNINLPRERNQLFESNILGEAIIKGLSSND